MIALLHLTLGFFSGDISDSFQLGSAACPFTLPLIDFPSSIHPEFVAFDVPPAAVAAATAAAGQRMLDCVRDITHGHRASSVFICVSFSHHFLPPAVEQLVVPASSLAETAALAAGLSLEASADDALQLLVHGDALFENLLSLNLNLWLLDGLYSPAVQQLLLFIAATHYLVRASAVTDNALVNCSAIEPTSSLLPPTCMRLLYIHKRFVYPAPSHYSHSMLPFGRTNFSAAIEAAGGHLFATLLHRHWPWTHTVPERVTDHSSSELIAQWSERALLEDHFLNQQKLTYGCAAGNSERVCRESADDDSSVKRINLELDIVPLEEQLVMDRCNHAEVCF